MMNDALTTTSMTDAEALRRAVRRNRKAYARQLRGEPGFDLLVLTAANEAQAESYREEVDERRSLGLLPPSVRVEVIADPPGERSGSGGATFNVLRQLGVRPDERALLLHCGGESRRFPAYGPSGKLFAPLPCPRPDARASTVFDEILVSLAPLAAKMSLGWLVASADVLLLFHAAGISPRTDAVTGLGFSTDAHTAKEHGIYVPGRGGAVRAFLQKPTMGELQASGALRPDGTTIVDTGVFIFPYSIVERLHRLSRIEAGHLPSDLYHDWVLPMVPSQSEGEYRATGDPAVRDALWETLHPIPLSVRVAHPARFVHLGTTRQWQDALLHDPLTASAMDFQSAFRSFSPAPPPEIGLLNSSLGEKDGLAPTMRPSSLLESCRIEGNTALESGAVAVGVADRIGQLRLPSGYVIDQLPVEWDSKPGWVTRVYPLDMDPKAKGEEVRLFGFPAWEWLTANGLSADELWPIDSSASQQPGPTDRSAVFSLWNARLFPIAETREESLGRAQWLLDCARRDEQSQFDRSATEEDQPTAFQNWLSSPRISFEACQTLVDRTRWRDFRRTLERDTLTATVRFAMDHDIDVRAMRLSPADFPFIRDELKDDLGGANGSLRAARAHWLMADLLKGSSSKFKVQSSKSQKALPGTRNPEPGTVRKHEAQAFTHICRAVDQGAPVPIENPRLVVTDDQTVCAEAPVRLDFAGGWSDTPPFSLEHGGAVLNVAVLLDGQRPVRAWVRPLSDPVLRVRSLDLGEEVTLTRRSEVLNYQNPRDPFALHKAALVLMNMVTPDGGTLKNQLERLGGGLEVVTESAVPKGSGLGTSSILGGVTLAALGKAVGLNLDAVALFDLVLALEQRLTTGGGWQDQIGGLMGGWKVTRTRPGLRQIPLLEPLDLTEDVRRLLNERAFILYSGYTRLARNILRNMVGQYLSRDARTLSVLHGMRPLVDRMTAALKNGELDAMGVLMDEANATLASIDPQSWPPHITQIVDTIRPHLAGAKPAGAGGGGFIMFMAKSAEDRLQAEAILSQLDLPPGARTYPLEVAHEGFQAQVK